MNPYTGSGEPSITGELSGVRTATAKRTGTATPPIGRGEAASGARASLEEQAYLRLKRDILTCAFKPGEILNEVQLCERLGIGRTPVHQAIAELQYDRLVQVIPRKGIVVRPVSIDEYLDLTDVRLVNDVEAARLAALHRTPEDLKQMERLIDEMESAYASDDLRTVILADRELHVFIARCSGNAVLEEVVRSIFDRTLRIWFVLHGATRRSVRPLQGEHRELLLAIRERDADRAASIMHEHIMIGRNNVISNDPAAATPRKGANP